MVAETPDTTRRPVQIPGPLHARLSRMLAEHRARTGHTWTFAEVIEEAVDRAEEADGAWWR